MELTGCCVTCTVTVLSVIKLSVNDANISELVPVPQKAFRALNYFASERGAKYCDERVCVSVCLSAHTSPKNTRPHFAKFSVGQLVNCGSSPSLRYVTYFRFCG